MANLSRSSVVLEAEPDEAPSREIDPDTPFRILVLGDFSGRSNRRLADGLGGRRPTLVDLDNFDEVLAAMAPSLRVEGVALRFRELDDFHPDAIYRKTEIFQKLSELRYEPARAKAASATPPPPADLLDNILDQADDSPAADASDAGDLAAFIKRVTAPHVEARPDAAKVEFAARVQAAAGEKMRAILHHSDFQALEAAWRAAWMLVQRLGDDARVYLLDVTLEEVLSDATALEKILAGAKEPWAVLVGNYAFADTEKDARRLTTLGSLARAARAPFLAEGQPPSGESAPESWQELRHSPAARWIGLALPRFLLRLPYGKDTSPVEAFPFEEMSGSVHAEYLWGNPAFCCAYLMGRPGNDREIDGLPVHVYKEGGASENKPCAEILMTEKDAELLMDLGYMPLASLKNQGAALLVRLQSIADPPTALG